MKKESLQIIYLNGPSSSGKTTLAKALQSEFDDLFLHVSIDQMISWMPEKVNDWTGREASLGYSWKKGTDASGYPTQELQIGPYAERISKTFQEVVLVLAQMGHHLIIDDVSFGKKQVDEWKGILKDFIVLWVGVNAPLSILEQREKKRGNRIRGAARGQYHKVHADATYDLEIDTHHATLDENILKIKSLAAGHANRNREKMYPLIRSLIKTDIPQIVSRYSFPWSTSEKTKTLWDTYYREQKEKVRTVAVIEKDGEILGYGSLLRKPECPFFAQKNIPEINAVWIDEKHRRKGLGRALIHWLENLANQEGYSQIGIGVGLYRDYGPAQQLYFQLGYTPEGNGITYKGEATVAGQLYPLDDDLILWLVKPLSDSKENFNEVHRS